MLSEEDIFNTTVDTTVEAISSYAARRLGKEMPFQILDLIMPNERAIRSIVGGLETSLGTTLWEPLATSLAKKNGFKINDGSAIKMPAPMPQELKNAVEQIYDERVRQTGTYCALRSKQKIQSACQVFAITPSTKWEKPPSGSGIDLWISKDGKEYIFDTKTVQPNVGSFVRYLRQILNWYSYFFAQFPLATLEARIVFPYNPYSPQNFWNNTQNNAKPLIAGQEAWVEDDFWELCTGKTSSYRIIHQALKHVGQEGLVSQQIKDLFGPNKRLRKFIEYFHKRS